MNLGNLTTRITELSRELTAAQRANDDDEVERIEVELANLTEELEDLSEEY